MYSGTRFGQENNHFIDITVAGLKFINFNIK
jgi:hypothetical protein